MKRYMCLLVPLLMLDIQASEGAVLFYDNFNDGPTGNIVTPLNWDVFNGTVDIGDPKDAWWGESEHATLDLEGSRPDEAGALIQTKQEFTLAPGTYELSFKAAGSSYENFSPSDTFSYGLTDIFTGTETYEWDRTAQFVYYKFNVTKSKQTRIFFDQDDATDAYGIHVDEIKLVRIIPESTTFALVDIKPGSDSNPININNGVLPVVILGTEDFDVTVVDIDSLLFGDPLLIDEGGSPVSPLRSAFEDVSDDGFLDLSLKFSIAEMSDNDVLGPDTIEGLLTGALLDGTSFEGMDSIRVVPPSQSSAPLLAAVPEPSTLALGLLGIGWRRRKRA